VSSTISPAQASLLWWPTRSLPLALFGGLAVWWTASWVLVAG
jgi:hypothetical protein